MDKALIIASRPNQGANVALISKALGHKSLETTTVYLDLEKEFVAESLRDYL